jgi:hypothetical protein
LDTEVQVLSLASTASVAEGQYTLTFGTRTTGCIDWHASALSVQQSLLSVMDNVLVERIGNGTSGSNYGYTYSIYFTGNGVQTSPSVLPLLVAQAQPCWLHIDPVRVRRCNYTSPCECDLAIGSSGAQERLPAQLRDLQRGRTGPAADGDAVFRECQPALAALVV